MSEPGPALRAGLSSSTDLDTWVPPSHHHRQLVIEQMASPENGWPTSSSGTWRQWFRPAINSSGGFGRSEDAVKEPCHWPIVLRRDRPGRQPNRERQEPGRDASRTPFEGMSQGLHLQSGYMSEPPSVNLRASLRLRDRYNSQGPCSETPWQKTRNLPSGL